MRSKNGHKRKPPNQSLENNRVRFWWKSLLTLGQYEKLTPRRLCSNKILDGLRQRKHGTSMHHTPLPGVGHCRSCGRRTKPRACHAIDFSITQKPTSANYAVTEHDKTTQSAKKYSWAIRKAADLRMTWRKQFKQNASWGVIKALYHASKQALTVVLQRDIFIPLRLKKIFSLYPIFLLSYTQHFSCTGINC